MIRHISKSLLFISVLYAQQFTEVAQEMGVAGNPNVGLMLKSVVIYDNNY